MSKNWLHIPTKENTFHNYILIIIVLDRMSYIYKASSGSIASFLCYLLSR
jgi:hypothetical protein